jgi:hypothetical protein
MRFGRMNFVALGLFAFGLAVVALPETSHAAPAAGARDTAPEDIIHQLYADYMSGKGSPKKSAEEMIRPYASRALRQAIDEEIHCERRSGEVCAIDSDYIIAGQDWGRLSDFHIDRSTDRNGLVLRVRFREEAIEPGRVVVTYRFVREDGAWRIDDVNDDNAAPDSLKAVIESYFQEYDENNKPFHKPK